MRYPAGEKAEIIRLVEQSSLPVRRTLEQIGVPRATFYRWYDLYHTGGPEALSRLLSDVMLIIVGEGEERPRLETLARNPEIAALALERPDMADEVRAIMQRLLAQ